MPTLVILESPYRGTTAAETELNVLYARACVRDSLRRGEAPIASHLLYTQPGILDDGIAEERKLGIDAGHAWLDLAEKVAVYTDRGISLGMQLGIERAEHLGVTIERRVIYEHDNPQK